MYSRNVEIRKVELKDLKEVFAALDSLDSWKLLMEKIPKTLDSEKFIPKYSFEDVKIIEQEGKSKSPSQVLFDEWGTSGRIRPTLETLLNLLIDNDLFRAADLVAVHLLGENPPERPKERPWSPIPISLFEDKESLESYLNSNHPGTDSLENNMSANFGFEKQRIKRMGIKGSSNESLNLSNVSDLSLVDSDWNKIQNCNSSFVLPNLSLFGKEQSGFNGIVNVPKKGVFDSECDIDVVTCKEESANIPKLSALNKSSRSKGSEENVNIPRLSELNKSSRGISKEIEESANIPKLSELNNSSRGISKEIEESANIPKLSELNYSSNIPNLSIFKSDFFSNSSEEIENLEIPLLSALEVASNGALNENENQSLLVEKYNEPIISALLESQCVSDLNVPVLSILNKRSKETDGSPHLKVEDTNNGEGNGSLNDLSSSNESSPRIKKKYKIQSSDLIGFSVHLKSEGNQEISTQDNTEISEGGDIIPNLSELQ